MIFYVVNQGLQVGSIEILGVSSSSLLQVGDNDNVALYSMFDTPPESVIVGRLIELQLPEGADEAEGEPRLRDRKPVNILFR
jgi:spore germination protein PD